MDDRKVKELFQQLKQDDAAAAPRFAGVMADVMNAARGERKAEGRFGLRAAMVSVMAVLVLLAGGWFWLAQQEQVPSPPPLPEQPWERTRPRVQDFKKKDFAGKIAPRQRVLHTGARAFPGRRTSQTTSMNALVWQWRSPTDFLLNTPGQCWLQDVPRLGVPRVEINPFDFERKNERNETEEQ